MERRNLSEFFFFINLLPRVNQLARFEGTVLKTSDTNFKFGGSQITFSFDISLGLTELNESYDTHGYGLRQNQLRGEVNWAMSGGLWNAKLLFSSPMGSGRMTFPKVVCDSIHEVLATKEVRLVS